jgi:hypothetical protein
MTDESNQYAILTKIFVESFKFTNSSFKPTIAFKIYDKPITMSLEKFCAILGILMFGTAKKIQNRPVDLLELYRGVTNDDDRIAQRGKIRNIQLPAVRYFAYYLATGVLGRENTSNISNYHLAFLATALDVSKKYNLGALIACRLAARGPIYGGIIVACIVAALGLSIAPNDILLVPQRLDLAAMKLHHFVTANSCAGKLVYRMLFCRWISCRKNTGYHATDPKIRTQGAECGRWIATKHGDGSLESSNAQHTTERDAELYPGSGPSW